MAASSLGTLSERTTLAARDALAGRRRGLRALLPFAGPAFLVSIAYMDPGNFATNIQAGARYGYSLLWVALAANVIAMLFQALSARLGIVTNQNLAELCRSHFPRPVVLAMWLVSELAAMATDLAEFLGGAIGLTLLLHVPLMAGMIATAVATFGVLALQGRGYRAIELVIAGLVAVISLAYLLELVIVPTDWAAAAAGTLLPRLPDGGAVTLAVGMVGATVMPHAIYLHSGLVQDRTKARNEAERRGLLRFANTEVLLALGLAGLVNMAMVAMAAAAFFPGHQEVAEIETAYHSLVPLFGLASAVIFAVALLASGLSSSAVGTMAGQVIMQGFLGSGIPLWLRRVLTMAPAFIVVGLGVNPTDALVDSQVVLSLALPVPMVALLLLLRRRDVMGAYVLGPRALALASAATAVVLGLNLLLLIGLLF